MSKLIEVLQKMPGIEKAQCPYDAKNIKNYVRQRSDYHLR